MLIHSLFFSVFALLVTALLAVTSLSAVHTLALHRAHGQLLAEADRATARIRDTAARAMASYNEKANALPLIPVPADTVDTQSGITSHTQIDSSPEIGSSAAFENDAIKCPGQDAEHQCNIASGTALTEQRVWQTIDLQMTAAQGESVNLRRHVLLRTLRIRPYATVIAVRDDGVSGAQLLGDSAGVAARASDPVKPNANDVTAFRDTRVHIYQPCRYLGESYKTMSTDGKHWATWQGGAVSAGHQMSCDNDPGETTLYRHLTRAPNAGQASSWGH